MQREAVTAESSFMFLQDRSSLLSSKAELTVGFDGRPRYRSQECLLFERKKRVVPRSIQCSVLFTGRSLFF